MHLVDGIENKTLYGCILYRKIKDPDILDELTHSPFCCKNEHRYESLPGLRTNWN